MCDVVSNYTSILVDDHFEYSLEFSKVDFCRIIMVHKISRIADSETAYRHGGRWLSPHFQIGPALEHCIGYYYQKWEDEIDCDFIGADTPRSKRETLIKDIQKIVNQDFDLDKTFQINSFSKWKNK